MFFGLGRQSFVLIARNRPRMATLWQKIREGRLSNDELPEELDLSDLIVYMEVLWRRTEADGREHGACIVVAPRGQLRSSHEVVGAQYGINPMHDDPAWMDLFPDHLGFFHTHPLYPNGESQMGFSHLDFEGVWEENERLSIVRSGSRVFALVQPQPALRKALEPASAIRDLFSVFQESYDRLGMNSRADHEANHTICREIGFAFYAGEFGRPLRKEVAP